MLKCVISRRHCLQAANSPKRFLAKSSFMASLWEPRSLCSCLLTLMLLPLLPIVPTLAPMILCVALFIIDWWKKAIDGYLCSSHYVPSSQLLHGVQLHSVASTFVCSLDLAWLH